ncbi:MAG: GGDEF domain-containing protein [Lachnospiraceae bacterium]|nr:GGDEF domain-containing protein [Lachnospiraceae bacterium]
MDRKLRKKRIAVIANGWSGEFLGLVLEGIRQKAKEDNTDVFMFTSYILWRDDDKRKKEQLKLFDLINPEDYDGFIILANTFNISEECEQIIKLLKSGGAPIVSTEVEIPGVPFIGSRNYDGMYELTKHLITKHNVRRVIYMNGITGNVECAERKKAVTDALAEHNLKLEGSIPGDFGFYTATQQMEEWLNENDQLPDAFICANDLMALGTISTLHKHGIEVPDDVIVTGYDHTKESRLSYPLVATVTRQWDVMGQKVYEELMNQIKNPDASVHKYLESGFVPSESCGCSPDEASIALRREKIRNMYPDSIRADMVEIFFQQVRLEMDKVASKEDFYETAKETFGIHDFFGPDYCFCVHPEFFEKDTEEYVRSVSTAGDKMDVIYEKSNGKSVPPRTINTSDIYPGYNKTEEGSDLYIVSLLNDLDYFMGYIVIKNSPDALYSIQLKKLINNLDLLLVSIKRYIFARKYNRELMNIYMTDSLTGLYNRTGCDKVLINYIQQEKAEGRSTMLLFVDINNMKIINDEYGHLNGDLAIKATADSMRKSLPDGWLIGRYGGDEFIAVGRYREHQTIEGYRELFAAALYNTMEGLKISFELTASAGCCVIHPDSNGTIEDYLKIADESMYEEKEKAHSKRAL